jgi:hypothetical protein
MRRVWFATLFGSGCGASTLVREQREPVPRCASALQQRETGKCSVFFGRRSSASPPRYPTGTHRTDPLTIPDRQTPSLGSAAVVRPECAANPTGITAWIGGSSPPGLRNRIGTRQDSYAGPQIGVAWKPKPAATEKLSSGPATPIPETEASCTLGSRIAGHWPHKNANSRHSARWSASMATASACWPRWGLSDAGSVLQIHGSSGPLDPSCDSG